MTTDLWRCYHCGGQMSTTPTAGRWECPACKSTFLIGRQQIIRHWPEPIEEAQPHPLMDHNRGDK